MPHLYPSQSGGVSTFTGGSGGGGGGHIITNPGFDAAAHLTDNLSTSGFDESQVGSLSGCESNSVVSPYYTATTTTVPNTTTASADGAPMSSSGNSCGLRRNAAPAYDRPTNALGIMEQVEFTDLTALQMAGSFTASSPSSLGARAKSAAVSSLVPPPKMQQQQHFNPCNMINEEGSETTGNKRFASLDSRESRV